MSQNVVADRYAIALFEIAKEQNTVQAWIEELRVVKEVVKEQADFLILLSSPNVKNETKKQLLKDVFSAVSPAVLHTFMLLLDRNRVNEIADVAESFIDLANDESGIANATVYSARPLTNEETERISASFAQKVGYRSLDIKNMVQPEVLGGLKVQIGNRIFDGSLKGKLDRLERTLTI